MNEWIRCSINIYINRIVTQPYDTIGCEQLGKCVAANIAAIHSGAFEHEWQLCHIKRHFCLSSKISCGDSHAVQLNSIEQATIASSLLRLIWTANYSHHPRHHCWQVVLPQRELRLVFTRASQKLAHHIRY